MKISLNWLKKYIDLTDMLAQPDRLKELLTQAGLEVEALTDLSKPFQNVFVGHILERKQHPNADRLTLCQVSTGQGRIHSIVCGAKNHKEGDNVVVALPGAILPGNFEIKLSSIRGVESGGMLCSESELGFAKDTDGILILKPDAPIGESFAKYWGLDDVVLDLKVTPNRADCLSHFGLARELSCLLDRKVEFPIEVLKESDFTTQSLMKVEVTGKDGCPRYAGRVIRGVKVQPSPPWLKQALESVGMNSVNNVVDTTNFVMMELGQPLHAFDLATLQGNQINVRMSVAGEKFRSLDGSDYVLDGTELMICDEQKPVALAGVVGGQNSGISDQTKDLFVESAYFRPSFVRRTARKFGIETDACYRYSRGVDPDVAMLALNRVCELLQRVAGGEISSQAIDIYPQPLTPSRISFEMKNLKACLGFEVAETKVEQWLTRLNFQIPQKSDGKFEVIAPLYRQDLHEDVDIFEEIARLEGYDKIPETVPHGAGQPQPHAIPVVQNEALSRFVRAEGFLEAVHYGFISQKWQEQFAGEGNEYASQGLKGVANVVALVNPLSDELNVMRSLLAPHLIDSVAYNSRHGNIQGRLYELGSVFHKSEAGYAEDSHLSGVIWGTDADLWQKTSSLPVFRLKGSLENLFGNLGIRSFQFDQRAPYPKFLHPHQSSTIVVEGKPVGFIGSLHPLFAEQLKLREPCAVFELRVDGVMRGWPRSLKAKPISLFPAVERDFAFVMDKTMPVSKVLTELKKAGGNLCQDALVFDVFEGSPLAAHQKSVAFRLLFQDFEKTLGEDELVKLHKTIIDSVSQKLSIQVR